MKVIFQKGALYDYSDGFEFYLRISKDLAEKFEFEFWNTIEIVKANPFLFQDRYRGIRISFFKSFPFGIQYVFSESTITVLRILHTKRFFK